jgi:hypothetical protein
MCKNNFGRSGYWKCVKQTDRNRLGIARRKDCESFDFSVITAEALRSQRKSKERIGYKGFDANSVTVQIAHSLRPFRRIELKIVQDR